MSDNGLDWLFFIFSAYISSIIQLRTHKPQMPPAFVKHNISAIGGVSSTILEIHKSLALINEKIILHCRLLWKRNWLIKLRVLASHALVDFFSSDGILVLRLSQCAWALAWGEKYIKNVFKRLNLFVSTGIKIDSSSWESLLWLIFFHLIEF